MKHRLRSPYTSNHADKAIITNSMRAHRVFASPLGFDLPPDESDCELFVSTRALSYAFIQSDELQFDGFACCVCARVLAGTQPEEHFLCRRCTNFISQRTHRVCICWWQKVPNCSWVHRESCSPMEKFVGREKLFMLGRHVLPQYLG